MRPIILRDGEIVIVDDDDFEEMNQHAWYAVHHPNRTHPTYYAARYGGLRCPSILMHRELMEAPPELWVDHRNLHGWDNRRANMRLCTPSQNGANARSRRPGQFRGVYKQKNRWTAQVRFNKKSIYIGMFATPEEAARAWDAKALELWGEFARLNFPVEGDTL